MPLGDEVPGPVEILRSRLITEWLPSFCDKQNLDPAGFNTSKLDTLAPMEARSFLRAVDSGVVIVRSGAEFMLPRTSTVECPFWRGEKSKSPRPITFAHESLVVVGMAGDLHLDYGWPIQSLQFESDKNAFDLLVHREMSGEESPYIAVEAKASDKDVIKLKTN